MTRFPCLPVKTYAQARPEIRNGDLLMACGDYMFSQLIQRATDSCWSHVAFVMRLDDVDRVMVLESIESKGVRTIPLSEYITNFEGTGRGYKGRLALARHRQFERNYSPERMRSMAQFAVDRFARPYDEDEIARIMARIAGSFLGFEKGEIQRDEEYICSEYVYECYRCFGLTVNHNPLGFISPADFARDADVDVLFEIEVCASSDSGS